MPTPFSEFNVTTVETSVSSALTALRNDLYRVIELHNWLSGYAQTDFSNAPVSMPVNDVAEMFAAIADAAALAQIFLTGQPPSTYPQAGSAYVYANSVDVVIGPDA